MFIKKYRITLLMFLALNGFVSKAQNKIENYINVYDGMSVEKFDGTNVDENKYNVDNKIYTNGTRLTYTYCYEKEGKRYLIGKGAAVQKGDYKIFDWKFVPADKHDNETVKNIILQAVPGNPFKDSDPDYNQTAIRYEYVTYGGKPFSREITGAIENDMNCWIHPPRNSFFRILETNPFPYIKAPYVVGTK
ncbi:hypothetical protein [Flavobacterium sp. UBA4197]|uniref:hypothetical protein n=1 Tax=Flavobacterium sp. UBA4197 TaxID=1946546 RepID=UPI00257D8283|nr:hypothetical protein [Flavobacterium sp. UBA4197]